MRTTYLHLACTLTLLLPTVLGCGDDGGTADTATGDGDGDSTGDGDGDPSGDGDGDPSGDGDGDPSGDGDGDPSGDGDGESGDGDGDSGDGDGDSGDGDGDGDQLPPDFLEQLTEAGGCGDVYIGVTNPGAKIGLLFNGAPLCQLAYDMGAQVRVSDLPSPDVELSLVLGTTLDDGCNDVGSGPQITTQWNAVSGTVTLTVVPTGNMPEPWSLPADATLELTNVTFEGNGLDPVVIDSLIVPDVAVGWFPG